MHCVARASFPVNTQDMAKLGFQSCEVGKGNLLLWLNHVLGTMKKNFNYCA